MAHTAGTIRATRRASYAQVPMHDAASGPQAGYGSEVLVTATACPAGSTRSSRAAETVAPRAAEPLPAAGERRGTPVRRPRPLRRGRTRPRAAADGAGRHPALARRTAVLPRRRPRPRGRRPGDHRAAAGPPCARPRRRPGSTPRGVQLFGVLPKLYIPVSGFVVTPVLGWWRTPEPGRRGRSRGDGPRLHRARGGSHGPGQPRRRPCTPAVTSARRSPVESALVWGFTAGVIDRLLHFAGWERPWDRDRQVPLDWRA